MMSELVKDTLVWSAIAGIGILAIGGFFLWSPWDRKRPRPPEHHPAE
jgi:hypothetical protein